MTLKDAVLKGEARAWGRVSDMVRAKGGRYRDAYETICILFHKEGRKVPTLADFDDKMEECNDLESGSVR